MVDPANKLFSEIIGWSWPYVDEWEWLGPFFFPQMTTRSNAYSCEKQMVQAAFSSKKKFTQYLSHRIFEYIHRVLNVVEKNN